MTPIEFDPLVAEWFSRRFEHATEPQTLGWPEIRAGRDVLISAPTGSGKTLAAFLLCIDDLVRAARAGAIEERIDMIYVSPLKALSNDVRKNLETPLAEIAAIAADQGVPLAPIRAAVRTGDTLAAERQQMLAHPPHILVTTPESLFILLTAEKSRKMLKTARAVIVDEIHAVIDDKRGAHLAISLERLDRLAERRLQRIGLSATVKPVETVARFLGENTGVISVGHRRPMDLFVEVPKSELGAVASNEMWDEIYNRIADLVRAHRTTLVFVNTRRLAERVSHHLAERLGEKSVLPHHGSLSRALRFEAEARLKNGELRAVVATASLELGIDVGAVELVCQVGSPRSIAVALQRIGRSGHWVGAKPEGRLFATTRDELVECAAIVRGIRSGELEELEIPSSPLDVLAQQIVAIAACEEFGEEDLFAFMRGAYPFRDLPRKNFDDVIEMLSEGIASSRGRRGAFLHRDQVNHRVRGRRGARLAAITSGGAIPDNANYQVVAEPEGAIVGTLDEDFAVESMAGDIFLLGDTSWRIRRVEPGRVRVEDAHGAAPSIPFWNGEAPGRTLELSREFSRLREQIVALDENQAVEFLIRDCGLERMGAEQAVEYVRAGAAALGALATQQTVIAERFFDEAGGMQLILHSPFGSRINRAWGLALRKRFCRSFNLELQAAATDNGIVISLSEQHAFPLEIIFGFLRPETVEPILTQAMLPAPMFGARWRWNATRFLAVLRFRGGRKTPPPILRMQSDDLMAAVFPDQAACAENLTGEIRIPDHPLVSETVSNCLHEAMDLDGLVALIGGINSGAIRSVAIDTAEPSPFSHEILNSNPYAYLDDAPLEERRARAVQLRRTLDPDMAQGVGALDAAAIAQVAAESWPVVRDADELHDALLTLCVIPPAREWREFFAQLQAAHRATVLLTGGSEFWVPAERLEVARLVYPDAIAHPPLAAVDQKKDAPLDSETAAAQILRGWLESSGPVTAAGLAARLAMLSDLVDLALARIESEGQALRGRFSSGSEPEWCNRRVLARIHRMTLGRLRREIEPVSTADFLRFLSRWQHTAQGSQLHGADGLLQVVRQLQGYEIPAAAWESDILPRRVARYEADLLDQICLSGEVMWGRLSPHPAFESEEPRRIRPTRAAPISLFLRQDASWLMAVRPPGAPEFSHPACEILAALQRRGASFFAELTRATGRLASELEDGLWELVAAGFVTSDGFENLRSLIDPRRRRGDGRGRSSMPRHAAGRWALIERESEAQARSEIDAEPFARQVLLRWGVVFRDLMARESLSPPWREMLIALRRLEARGEVRGGRFVSGFTGEQFAMPEALELLRAVRRSDTSSDEIVPAADPLNLSGILLPGPRIHPLSGGAAPLLGIASENAASMLDLA